MTVSRDHEPSITAVTSGQSHTRPLTEDRFVFVPLEQATVPPAGLIEHLKDRWWFVHPVKGVAFFDKKVMAPQCNGSEALTRRMAEAYSWAEVRFIPSVFRRINPQDYA